LVRLLPALLALVLVIYAIVDCLQSDARAVRNLPRLGWLGVIVLLPVLGAVAWLALGRPRAPRRPGQGRPRPTGPDDDPDFLRRMRPFDS
jgi:hypothetical protein